MPPRKRATHPSAQNLVSDADDWTIFDAPSLAEIPADTLNFYQHIEFTET
jgi:hypothetical protein